MLPAPSQSHAPGTMNFPLCSVNTSLLPSWLVAPLVCKWPDFLDRDVCIPSLSGLSDFWMNWSCSLLPHLASPSVKWQSPWARGLNCTALCNGIAHCQSQPVGRCCKVVCVVLLFSSKGDDFCITFRLATCQPTCCCLMLMCFWISDHQP